MGRLVDPRTVFEQTTPARAANDKLGPASRLGSRERMVTEKPGSGMAERMVKFIPGEIIAFYIGAVGILNSLREDEHALRIVVAWACLVVGLALTPAYVWRLSSVWDRAARVHAIVSTAAFLIWAYSLGGAFQYQGWYVPWLGSILISGFTLSSAFIALPLRVVQVNAAPGSGPPDGLSPSE